MSALAFFDTNILVHADDEADPKRQKHAAALVARHLRAQNLVISLQVLQEYFVTVTRKLGMPAPAAQRKVEILAQSRVVRFEAVDVIAAIELHRLRQISFWDALIVHAARSAGAAVLYSEDLQSGTVFGGLNVVNPFASI
jgi:predicted nucleic acid-binding protein